MTDPMRLARESTQRHFDALMADEDARRLEILRDAGAEVFCERQPDSRDPAQLQLVTTDDSKAVAELTNEIETTPYKFAERVLCVVRDSDDAGWRDRRDQATDGKARGVGCAAPLTELGPVTRREEVRQKVERFLMKRLGCSIRLRSETPDEHDDRLAEDRLARWQDRMDDETATRDVLGNLK